MIDSLLGICGCVGSGLWFSSGSMLSERDHGVVDARLCVVEVKRCVVSELLRHSDCHTNSQ